MAVSKKANRKKAGPKKASPKKVNPKKAASTKAGPKKVGPGKATSRKPVAESTGHASASDPAAANGAQRRQRAIQAQARKANARRQAQEDKAGKSDKKKPPTGARRQPRNPMPAQSLRKPGNEHDLELEPRYLAPDYAGSGKLAGKVALVTGGDSGIGRAVAVLFAREGADVAIIYLTEHTDAKATCKLVEAEGARGIAISGDVGDPGFCDAAVAEVVDTFGGLDVLVNNAAFQQHCTALEDLTDAHLHETLQTNIGGYFQMARAALPHLREGSCIINTGSETGLFGSKDLLDYSATKGAIHAFTKALASNLSERGIRVNAVAPGPVWTPLNPADKTADDVASFGKHSAMGRPAQPEELSPAYVFLAAPSCAGYINGVVLPVMGGPHG